MPKTEKSKFNPLVVCPVCKKKGVTPYLKAPDRFHLRRELYRLVRCPSCSLVWVDNPPRPEEMDCHYTPGYDREVSSAGESVLWQKPLKTLLEYKSSGTILDIGCSSGSFLKSLSGQSWSLHGIEYSANAAKKAEVRTGAKIFVGDALAAPFQPESFDVITCFHLLEHMRCPREVMTKIHEWLKPNGVLYLRVPNINSGEARIFRSYWFALELPRHLYHFSPASLTHLTKCARLEAACLSTLRVPFLEQSIRYVWDAVLERCGMTRKPLATMSAPSLAWKISRKVLRLTLIPIFTRLVPLAGGGQVIEAVFIKKVPHG